MEQRKNDEREDPRVLRTRQLLLQAFTDLFSEKGFHAMTVQDITERASVHRGTFYAHFEDKYAILQYWLREQFRQRIASPVLCAGPWSRSTLRLLIQRIIEWFAELHDLTRSEDRALIPLVVTTLQEALFELLVQEFQPVVSVSMEQRGALETVAMVTSWAIFGSGFQCFHQWDERQAAVPPAELANKVTAILIGGLAQALPAFQLD